MGEWARTVLLAQVNSSQEIILAEILALRNAVPEQRADSWTADGTDHRALRKLIERVDRESRVKRRSG